MIVLSTARLSGLQATADSKAAQMLARFAAEVLPPAPLAARRGAFMVQVEAPVAEVEGVASGQCCQTMESNILRKSGREYRSRTMEE